jgi:hypothetical protein
VRGGELGLDTAQRPQHITARASLQISSPPAAVEVIQTACAIRSASATLPGAVPFPVHILDHPLPEIPAWLIPEWHYVRGSTIDSIKIFYGVRVMKGGDWQAVQ